MSFKAGCIGRGACVVESLEGRVLFASGTGGVTLYDTSGAVAVIDPHKVQWLLFHGLYGSRADTLPIGVAVQKQVPGEQVLVVDYSGLASLEKSPTSALAVQNAWRAGDVVFNMIRAAGQKAANINLIGFSLGGQVEDRLAKDLKGKKDRVNRVIALDPGSPKVGVNSKGHGKPVVPQFSGNASYSISFVGADTYGYLPGGLTADDTVLLRGLSSDDLTRHLETSDVFLRMMERDGGLEAAGGDHVSGVFSIGNIFNGTLPGWRRDGYAPGFEGVVDCVGDGAGGLVPSVLTYVNGRGHVVRVS